MRLWVNVLDDAGQRLGDGPLTPVTTATVKRKLDGAGSWSFTLPASDPRSNRLLTVGRTVVLYGAQPGSGGGEAIRELGRGRVTDIGGKESATGPLLTVRGLDALDDLKRASTWLNRVYDDQPVAAIASELAGLAGWTAEVDAGLGNTTIRYNGVSVLKALQALAQQQGLHLRHEGGTTLKVGALGQDNGLRIVQRRTLYHEIYLNNEVVFPGSLSWGRSIDAVANVLLPVGYEGSVTLEHCTRSGPYAIQTMTGPGGDTLYTLQDDASIAANGRYELVKAFPDIKPLGDTATDLERAANALYDAAAAWMGQRSAAQQVYTLTLEKAWAKTIRAGDKVRLIYKGAVVRDGVEMSWIDTNALYWVLEVTENLGSEAQTVQVSLSNVDRLETDGVQLVADALDVVNRVAVGS